MPVHPDGSGQIISIDPAGGWRPSVEIHGAGGGGAAVAVTDRSGTITTGGQAQQMMALNAGRTLLFISNDGANEDLWIRLTGTAAIGGAGSIRLGPGDFWDEPVTNAVSVIAATTGHAWTAMEG